MLSPSASDKVFFNIQSTSAEDRIPSLLFSNNTDLPALMVLTQDESNKLHSILSKDIDINLINSSNLNYDHNINILPSYLSKGLEFDSVIIIDSFDRDNIIDLKLLYVSMTRALHKLYIKKY